MFEMVKESSETKEFSDCGKSRSHCPMVTEEVNEVVTDETEQVQEPSEEDQDKEIFKLFSMQELIEDDETQHMD